MQKELVGHVSQLICEVDNDHSCLESSVDVVAESLDPSHEADWT